MRATTTAHRKIMNQRALPINTSSLNFEPVTPTPGNAKRFFDTSQENSAIAIQILLEKYTLSCGVIQPAANDGQETDRLDRLFHDQDPFVGYTSEIRTNFFAERGHKYQV